VTPGASDITKALAVDVTGRSVPWTPPRPPGQVFPGEGALRKQGRTAGAFSIVAVSYGLQAGVQSFGYAAAKSLTTTTIQHDVYSFVFGQKGLMAEIGLQGSKISRIDSLTDQPGGASFLAVLD
jgi:hypothetical protein